MTNTAIVAIVFAAVAAVALAALAWTQVADPVKHRGEAAEAPDPVDDHYATAYPLEYVPAHPDPALRDHERELAGSPAARLATRLDNRSNR